jgi:prophage antirepressor-like protein
MRRFVWRRFRYWCSRELWPTIRLSGACLMGLKGCSRGLTDQSLVTWCRSAAKYEQLDSEAFVNRANGGDAGEHEATE